MSMVKISLVLAIIAALGGAAIWLYNKGGESVEVKIERQNNAAGDTSDKARSNYDLCVRSGRVFDFATGKCGRPSTRARN